MNNFNFTPVDGLLNKESFPSKPESEEQARTQIQTPLNQLRDFINTNVVSSVNSLESLKNSGGTIGGNTTINGNLTATSVTAPIIDIGTPLKDSNGYSKLPNGMILQWGKGRTLESDVLWVQFPSAFPTSCVNVTLTSFESTTTPTGINSVHGYTKSGVNIRSNQNDKDFMWLAIGY